LLAGSPDGQQAGLRKAAASCRTPEKSPEVSRMVPLSHILALSAALFVIGAAGFVIRRNIITVFMCIELMLNAVNVAFIGFSRYLGNLDGQLFVFFVIVVAAAEATVGLAIIIALYRNRNSLNIGDLDSMKM
jgi:NADH-quinone oxidoreductase subunit K